MGFQFFLIFLRFSNEVYLSYMFQAVSSLEPHGQKPSEMILPYAGQVYTPTPTLVPELCIDP